VLGWVGGLFYDAFRISDYMAANVRMIDELERVWKEAVLA
jgi:hypothetical protein